MNRLFLLIGILGITGCAPEYTPSTFPPVDASLMTAPCKLSSPSAGPDEDLAIDVQNAECVRRNRLKVYRLQDWVRNVTTE